ncbi:MAG: OmpA family protein [Proteobacteria bacterium]|nr:OmpA family protein [Pseudomonadota bacterium]
MSMRVLMLGVSLLLLGACDEPRTVARTASGARVVDCAAPIATGTYRNAGPCYNGTDITDRRNYDTTRDITEKRPDNIRDVTDRRNRDSVLDRTVYCIEVAAMISAPSFMVFFDWDKSNLTEKARSTIADAAAAYRQKGGARVTATGHTDTSGPEAYNMALSLRRANAVKDQLVHDGVKAEDISVVGLGETSPLVKTADGVREAQNRRVEIVIR